jgi:flagellar protein FlbD
MITITRLNDKEIVINADLIETIEENPDTTITMTTGRKFIAKEEKKEIIDRIVEYKKNILANYIR